MIKTLRFNKSFITYLIGQTISSLGDGFYLIAFIWLTLKLSNGKGVLMGGVLSVYMVGELIFGFIAGPVSDLYNKKKILIFIDTLRGLTVLILYILVKTNVVTIFHIYILTFIFSVLSPFFHRTEFTIIPELIGKNELLKANGILGGVKRLMQIISPVIGGIFIAFLRIENCFLFDSISFFLSSFCILFIATNYTHKIRKQKYVHLFFREIKEGYKIVINSSFLLTLGIYAACINFFAGPMFPLLPLISVKRGLPVSNYGFMMGALSAGMILSSFFIGILSKWFNHIKILLLGLSISAISIALIGLSKINLLLIFSSFLLGVGLNVTNLPISTLIQEVVPKERIGMVSSFVFTFAQIAMPVSIVLSGLMADLFSLESIFITISLIIIIGVIIGIKLPQFREDNIISICDETSVNN
jgi:MFS family permease